MSELRMLGIQADNDNSAGLIAEALGMDTSCLLTNIAVLNTDGYRVQLIECSNPSLHNIHFKGNSSQGTGGMESKHNVALRLASKSIRTIIGNARDENIILNAAKGNFVGTTYKI